MRGIACVLSVALSLGFVAAPRQPQPKAKPTIAPVPSPAVVAPTPAPNATAGPATTPTPTPMPALTPAPAVVGKAARSWDSFNYVYDCAARVVKLILFFLAALLIIWKWRLIDWRGTHRGLIENYSPFRVQSPERQVQPAATAPAQADQAVTEPAQAPAKPAAQKPAPVPAPPKPAPPKPATDYLNIRQFGQVVFTTDRPYEITGDRIVFDKLLLKGNPDYSKPFLYAGREVIITHIEEYIGLLVSGGSVEGPVLRRVVATLVR